MRFFTGKFYKNKGFTSFSLLASTSIVSAFLLFSLNGINHFKEAASSVGAWKLGDNLQSIAGQTLDNMKHPSFYLSELGYDWGTVAYEYSANTNWTLTEDIVGNLPYPMQGYVTPYIKNQDYAFSLSVYRSNTESNYFSVYVFACKGSPGEVIATTYTELTEDVANQVKSTDLVSWNRHCLTS